MSVHDACTLHAGGCLRNISSVSPWYPLVGIPIGVHGPHSATLGHPLRLKVGKLAEPNIYFGWRFILLSQQHSEPRLLEAKSECRLVAPGRIR